MKKARGIGSVASAPVARQYRSRLNAAWGSARLDALHTDFSAMRAGMFSHDSIGSPKTCVGAPRACKYAATERPYGPAPMTAVVVAGFWAVVIARTGRSEERRVGKECRSRW